MLLVNLRFALLGGNPEVDCHVRHHGVHRNVVSTLCEVLETLTEWKFKSMTDGLIRTERLTGVGARDACASKNLKDY